jgi:hypothetical protein
MAETAETNIEIAEHLNKAGRHSGLEPPDRGFVGFRGVRAGISGGHDGLERLPGGPM